MKEIKKGIYYHRLASHKYKTNLLTMIWIAPYTVKSATARDLLSNILMTGSQGYETTQDVEAALAQLYGADLGISCSRQLNYHELVLSSQMVRPDLIPDPSQASVEQWVDLIESLMFQQDFAGEAPLTRRRFHREYQQQIQKLTRYYDNKSRLANLKLYTQLYPNQAELIYGAHGALELLEKTSFADIAAAYQSMIANDQLVILAHGEFDEDRLLERIESWPLAARSERLDYTNNEHWQLAQGDELLTETTHGHQGQLRMAFKLPAYSSYVERLRWTMVNALLGGLPNSRLFTQIRERQSLAYSIHSHLVLNRHLLIVSAGVDPEQGEYVSQEVLKEIQLLKEELAQGKDLSELKLTMKSYRLQMLDRQYQELNLVYGAWMRPDFDLSLSFYESVIDQTQPEDLLALMDQVELAQMFFLKGALDHD